MLGCGRSNREVRRVRVILVGRLAHAGSVRPARTHYQSVRIESTLYLFICPKSHPQSASTRELAIAPLSPRPPLYSHSTSCTIYFDWPVRSARRLAHSQGLLNEQHIL